MAVRDLSEGDVPEEGVTYDVCLIGAGAAGISVAQAFAGSRFSVCLLESGGLGAEADTQSLYEGDVTGHAMTMDVGRYRVLGGSTSKWTGRCGMLDDIDFASRPWVPHSGWPIDLDDLEPYYKAAQLICGFAEPWIEDEHAARMLGVPPTNDSRLRNFMWRYAPIGNRVYRNWGVEYRQLLQDAGNVDTILHANMTKWHASPDGGQVEAVTISTLDVRQRVVRARTFVLCGGGLESTRLFLSSADDVPGGLGSGYGMAGRFFMQHPRGRIGRLEANARTALALQDRHAIFGVRDGLQYETGFALTERAQREGGLLNASVILTYDADPDSGWAAFKSLASTEPEGPERTYGRAGTLMRMAKDPRSIASNLWRKGRQKRHAAFPVSGIDLLIDLEQTPDPDSRITLSSDRDRLGMRKARVDWRIGDDERRTAAQFGHFLADHFTRTGGGKVELDDWVHDSGPVGDELTGTYHHIATLRMSQSPRDGVVDGNCRVHGVDNLYVSSCATFATGGHVNPTFTIVALGLRLADHIRDRLNRPQLRATRTAPEVAVVS